MSLLPTEKKWDDISETQKQNHTDARKNPSLMLNNNTVSIDHTSSIVRNEMNLDLLPMDENWNNSSDELKQNHSEISKNSPVQQNHDTVSKMPSDNAILQTNSAQSQDNTENLQSPE